MARLDVFAADASRRPRHAPVAAFARDALVFAAGAAFADARGGGALALYDARHYRAGPFATFRVDRGALAAVAAPEAEAPRGGIDRGGRRPPAERARRRGVAGAAEATARATRGGGAGRVTS